MDVNEYGRFYVKCVREDVYVRDRVLKVKVRMEREKVYFNF